MLSSSGPSFWVPLLVHSLFVALLPPPPSSPPFCILPPVRLTIPSSSSFPPSFSPSLPLFYLSSWRYVLLNTRPRPYSFGIGVRSKLPDTTAWKRSSLTYPPESHEGSVSGAVRVKYRRMGLIVAFPVVQYICFSLIFYNDLSAALMYVKI